MDPLLPILQYSYTLLCRELTFFHIGAALIILSALVLYRMIDTPDIKYTQVGVEEEEEEEVTDISGNTDSGYNKTEVEEGIELANSNITGSVGDIGSSCNFLEVKEKEKDKAARYITINPGSNYKQPEVEEDTELDNSNIINHPSFNYIFPDAEEKAASDIIDTTIKPISNYRKPQVEEEAEVSTTDMVRNSGSKKTFLEVQEKAMTDITDTTDVTITPTSNHRKLKPNSNSKHTKHTKHTNPQISPPTTKPINNLGTNIPKTNPIITTGIADNHPAEMKQMKPITTMSTTSCRGSSVQSGRPESLSTGISNDNNNDNVNTNDNSNNSPVTVDSPTTNANPPADPPADPRTIKKIDFSSCRRPRYTFPQAPPPSPPSPKPITTKIVSTLPSQLILKIGNYCDANTLSSLVLLNRRFCMILRPRLFQLKLRRVMRMVEMNMVLIKGFEKGILKKKGVGV